MNLWTWLRTSCEAGWKRHARFLGLSWIVGLVVCAIAAVQGEGLHYFVDFRETGGRWEGAMTLVSSFCLVVAGWSLFVPARRVHRIAGRGRELAGWVLGGLGGVVLGFDEVLQLHESFAHWMVRHHVPGPLGLDQDMWVFGAYALGLAITLALLWPSRRPLEPAMLPLLMAIACFAMSQVVDQLPWNAMDHRTQQWVGAMEEIYKVLGSWSLAMCGLLTADEGTQGSGSGA